MLYVIKIIILFLLLLNNGPHWWVNIENLLVRYWIFFILRPGNTNSYCRNILWLLIISVIIYVESTMFKQFSAIVLSWNVNTKYLTHYFVITERKKSWQTLKDSFQWKRWKNKDLLMFLKEPRWYWLIKINKSRKKGKNNFVRVTGYSSFQLKEHKTQYYPNYV